MTKKHFDQLAAALRTAKPGPDAPAESAATWHQLCFQIASTCESANPAFRRITFLTACGL